MTADGLRYTVRREGFEPVLALYAEVFEVGAAEVEAVREKLAERRDVMAVVAWDGERAVGFKLGYACEPEVFYSWLGGVLPGWRRRGIGHALMQHQHAWCEASGYTAVRTRTVHTYHPMIRLNLACGFERTGTLDSERGLKVLFEKRLSTR